MLTENCEAAFTWALFETTTNFPRRRLFEVQGVLAEQPDLIVDHQEHL